MSTCKYLLSVTLFCCTLGGLQACSENQSCNKRSNTSHHPGMMSKPVVVKRCYIAPHCVRIDKTGICILKKGKKIRIKSLLTDKKGRLYVEKQYCSEHDHWDFAGWPECPGCADDRDSQAARSDRIDQAMDR